MHNDDISKTLRQNKVEERKYEILEINKDVRDIYELKYS